MIEKHRTDVQISRPIPPEIEAGSELRVKVQVSCPSRCSLSGAAVKMIGADGLVTSTVLGQGDEAVNEAELTVTVPDQIGEFVWTVVFPRHETEISVHEETSSPPMFFRTIPHKTSMAVWDVRSPVASQSPFRVKVGMRCSASCRLARRPVEVHDERGTRVGGGRLGDAPWSGTSALYWAEVDLRAPSCEGVAYWLATFSPEEFELPHEEASASFSFRTDKPAEHHVRITVVDKATGASIADVEVRVGLYTMSTDERGVVNLELPKGTYELSIRKDGFTAAPVILEVADDLTVQVDALTASTIAEMEEKLAAFEGYPW